jgi:uncharacterized protein YkwD
MSNRHAALGRNLPTRWRFLATAVLLAAGLLATPAASQEDCRVPTAEEEIVVELINEQRALAGLGPVEIDAGLVAAAARHTADMLDGCFLSHTGSDGSSSSARMSAAGYPNPLGETAGAGQVSPEQIVQAWMNSSGHRAILLHSAATHVGVSHAWADSVCTVTPFDIVIAEHFWNANFGRSGQAPLDPSSCAPADEPGPPACSDGIDNDGDGFIDHPADDGCRHASQLSETEPNCGLGFELVVLLPPLFALRARRRGGRSSI